MICSRLINGVLGLTWRLGFGIDDPIEPEGERFGEKVAAQLTSRRIEWQDHPADINYPLTPSK